MAKGIAFQLYLPKPLARSLTKAAQARRVSRSALVREYIKQGLALTAPLEDDPASRLVGMGASSTRNTAERHDDYLADIYRAPRRPR